MKIKIKRGALAVVIVILALSLAFTGVISYAEYTKSSRAKRVITSNEGGSALFSSNYMGKNTNPDPDAAVNIRTVYTDSPGNACETDVTVCNYAQGNVAKMYENDISYTLTATLVIVEDGEKRSITNEDNITGKTVTLTYKGGSPVTIGAGQGSNTHTFASSTLDHRRISTDVCSIRFSSAFNSADNNVKLHIVATLNSTYHGITSIEALIDTGVSSTVQSDNWEGQFNEAGALGVPDSPDPEDLDGFNYMISGHGAGTATLRWKHGVIVPSQVFTSGKTIRSRTISTVDWDYVEFHVDSDTISRYDLQFYRVDATQLIGLWSEVTGSVVFSFEADEPE